MKIATVTLRENEMNTILSENHERKIKVRSLECHLGILNQPHMAARIEKERDVRKKQDLEND